MVQFWTTPAERWWLKPVQLSTNSNLMIVLGIETSCDETGIALLGEDATVLAQAIHSQVDMHREYGGVVPELASRDHIRRVLPLVRHCLGQAGLDRSDIDAIAVTVGPGLAGALLVGASIGFALGHALGIPVVGVHHLEGHLLSPLLARPAPRFPFVALLVSGGHTQLMRVDGFGRYTLLGETQDDAAGEAFDKTAQLLGLGYPGGPAVSRLAEFGAPGAHRFGNEASHRGHILIQNASDIRLPTVQRAHALQHFVPDGVVRPAMNVLSGRHLEIQPGDLGRPHAGIFDFLGQEDPSRGVCAYRHPYPGDLAAAHHASPAHLPPRESTRAPTLHL